MRWFGKGSDNVEDRRSGGGGAVALGGGAIVIALIIGLITGKNPMELLGSMQQQGGAPQTEATQGIPQDEAGRTASHVLESTEVVWNKLFEEEGERYQEPTMVLFRDQVSSACGTASSAMGPFYCPGDGKIYIDLSFYDELKQRFGAPGDFANAYVIAHEVGHHIQNLMGTTQKLHEARGRVSEREYNRLSVRLELQADFYAGVWAHYLSRMESPGGVPVIEAGDIEEALNAANAIGDDRLQRQSQGQVVPDAFTHGTSEQRMRWFKKGFDTGDMRQGDTFNTTNL